MIFFLVATAFAGPFEAGVAAVERGDLSVAAAAFEEACQAGEQRGCANLAAQLERGHGVTRDVGRAARLHRGACEADLALSCDALGTLTANGVGVPADDAAAVALYRRACDLGLGAGCGHLAVMVDGGFGVERSWEQAKALYGLACDLGELDVCVTLGRKLVGLRRPDAVVEGQQRVERACEGGHAEGCAVAAAVAAEQGQVRQARELAERACGLGHQASCR